MKNLGKNTFVQLSLQAAMCDTTIVGNALHTQEKRMNESLRRYEANYGDGYRVTMLDWRDDICTLWYCDRQVAIGTAAQMASLHLIIIMGRRHD